MVCGVTFDRDKEAAVAIPNKRRYAHEACFQRMQADRTKEQKDKDDLEAYIMKLFNTEFVPVRAQQQIKQFIKEYNYTYSGMLKSLKYFYEVKNGSIEKANGGIGIIPHIYDNAYNYYYSIWLAQQENNKRLEEQPSIVTIPQVEIHIPNPKKEPMGRKREYFSFLDEE